jgi:hypothetical protein
VWFWVTLLFVDGIWNLDKRVGYKTKTDCFMHKLIGFHFPSSRCCCGGPTYYWNVSNNSLVLLSTEFPLFLFREISSLQLDPTNATFIVDRYKSYGPGAKIRFSLHKKNYTLCNRLNFRSQKNGWCHAGRKSLFCFYDHFAKLGDILIFSIHSEKQW